MIKTKTTYDLSQIPEQRVGLAYVNMNCWRWDSELFGKQPKGWTKMSLDEKHRNKRFRKAFYAIDERLTERQKSMYWWLYEIGRSYEEWLRWYTFNIEGGRIE